MVENLGYTMDIRGSDMQVKLRKIANSLVNTLPKSVIEGTNFKENSMVTVELKDNNTIELKVVEDNAFTFDSLFENWEGGSYTGGEFDWGDEGPRGKEVW